MPFVLIAVCVGGVCLRAIVDQLSLIHVFCISQPLVLI